MSARGLHFLERWNAEHIPDDAEPDSVLASELADQALVAAESQNISAREIYEEVGSMFVATLNALRRRQSCSLE
jgi:hypothetical protein